MADRYRQSKRDKVMGDRELVELIARKMDRGLNDSEGELSDVRKDMLDRYRGSPQGDEREGYSQFRTREVLEAVEWATPALLRIFVGSQKVVSFDPTGPDDEAAAEQETDVVNYRVMRANGGSSFIALYTFIKDSLINPTAYAKVWVEMTDQDRVHNATGITEDALMKIVEMGDVEVEELDEYMESVEVPSEDGTLQMIEVPLYDVKYRESETGKPVLRIMAVPGEEVIIDDDLATLNLDESNFVVHRNRKTFSELVRMGYDADELEDVGSTHDNEEWNDERVHRFFYEDEDEQQGDDEDDGALRNIWIHEAYLWVDYDGSGLAQYRKVVTIGTKVFENEETDYQPMVAMSSIIMPHKHAGMSIAQLVEDLQRLSTVLMRQLLDNTYQINVARKYVAEDSMLPDGSTMDALQNTQAEFVPFRGPDIRQAVQQEQVVSILDDILPIIQHVQGMASMRSGVAPENNVDPQVLQQSTYGAFMGAMEKAGERIELLARVMAETGIKEIFRKAHKLCRMHPDLATTLKLRGEWVESDPSTWSDRTDMSVNVGLGFNSRQQMVMLATQLLEIQERMKAVGLVTPANIYNALKKIVEESGTGSVEEYFVDPSSPGWQPPQPAPDPQMVVAQGQVEYWKGETQRKGFEAQAKVQHETQTSGLEAKKLELEARSREFDLMKQNAEMKIKLIEAEGKVREIQADAAKREADVTDTQASAGLKVAQTQKTYAEIGKVQKDTEKVDADIDKVDADIDNVDANTETTLNPPKDPNKEEKPKDDAGAK